MSEAGSIIVSAPGSLMLLGEHAVLHGRRALVCAINRRIRVELSPLPEELVRIHSSLGEYQSPLNNLVDHPSFRFILQAIRQQQEHLPGGFELTVESGFSADIGFGSSAAVTVAAIGALMQWIMGEPPGNKALFSQALQTVRAVQGGGSGADLAASVYGGIVLYQSEEVLETFSLSVPLTAVYCGYKTPTAEVIAKVNALHEEQPDTYRRIYDEIDDGVAAAVPHLRDHNLPAFGEILNSGQVLMDDMGVNTPELQDIVSKLQADPEVFGAKISGSGLGDCAIGLGYAGLTKPEDAVHHLEISASGCEYHG